MSSTAQHTRTSGGAPRAIPSVEEPVGFTLPRYVETELPNGLKVIVVRQPSVPTVHLRLMVPFADNDNDMRHPARVNVLAGALFAGTSRRDRLAVDADLANFGGVASAQVDPLQLLITGSALAPGLSMLLDVVIDAVTDAAFREDEVARVRDITAQGVMVQRSDPKVIAREALQQRRFGMHPVTRRFPALPDIAAVSVEELHTARREQLVPRGSTLLLVGDVDLDDALTEIERATAAWTSEASARLLPPLPPIFGGDLLAVPMPGAPEAHLRLSAAGVSITDPQATPLTLAALALGGGFSSRLVEVIREQLQYCYSAHAGLEFVTDISGQSGAIVVSVSTATETAVPALQALRGELNRFCTEPPSAEEIDVNRQYAIGSQFINAMSQSALVETLGSLAVHGLGVDWLTTQAARLAAATPEDIAAAARDFFSVGQFTGVILGDIEALGPQLAEAGGVVAVE